MGKVLFFSSVFILSGLFEPTLGFATCNLGNVTMFGDSHFVGGMGQKLYQNLRGSGCNVDQYAVCGSAPSHWTNTAERGPPPCGYAIRTDDSTDVRYMGRAPSTMPHLEQLLNNQDPNHRPQTVVMSFGDNMGSGNAAEQARNMMTQIRAQYPNARCVWITPPNSPRNTAIGQLNGTVSGIREGAPDCQIIDGRELSNRCNFQFLNDGLHHTMASGNCWGDAVADRINNGTGVSPQIAAAPNTTSASLPNVSGDPRRGCESARALKQNYQAEHDRYRAYVRRRRSTDQATQYTPLPTCTDLKRIAQATVAAYRANESVGSFLVNTQTPNGDVNAQTAAANTARLANTASTAEGINRQQLLSNLSDLDSVNKASKKIIEELSRDLQRRPTPTRNLQARRTQERQRSLKRQTLRQLQRRTRDTETILRMGNQLAHNLGVEQAQLDNIQANTLVNENELESLTVNSADVGPVAATRVDPSLAAATQQPITPVTGPAADPAIEVASEQPARPTNSANLGDPDCQQQLGDLCPSGNNNGNRAGGSQNPPQQNNGTNNAALAAGALQQAGGLLNNQQGNSSAQGAAGAENRSPASSANTPHCFNFGGTGGNNCQSVDNYLPKQNGVPVTVVLACGSGGQCRRINVNSFQAVAGERLCTNNSRTNCGTPLP